MRTLCLISLSLLAVALHAQDTLTPLMVSTGNVSRMKYYEVYKNDGLLVKVGDTLKLGIAIGGKYFSYISEYDILAGTTDVKLDAQYSGNNCIIKRIYVAGSSRAGYSAYMQFKGPWALSMYIFPFEAAVSSGEIIIPNFYTSDLALSELKKAKDKLDLGIITSDEYNRIRAELIKFISKK